MERLAVVILGAGLGKRMGGGLPKVVAQANGRSLIERVLETSVKLKPEVSVIVVGHGAELVRETVEAGAKTGRYTMQGVTFAVQEKQLGTGNAVKAALSHLAGFVGTVLILYGDVPLILHESLRKLLAVHEEEKATLTIISLKGAGAEAYGRVVRDTEGRVVKIVEIRDCSALEALIDETNAGIYAVDSAFLKPAVDNLKNENAQREYYLTDIVEHAHREGQRIGTYVSHDAAEFQGVNTRADLARVKLLLMERKIASLTEAGVTIDDPRSLYLDEEVTVGSGTRIGPGVVLAGSTVIGERVLLEGNTRLENCTVENGATIEFGVSLKAARVKAAERIRSFTAKI